MTPGYRLRACMVGSDPSEEVRRWVIFINKAAGGVAAAADWPDLLARLREARQEAKVHRVSPERLLAAVRAELGQQPTLFVIGGGDGSVRTLASAVAGTEHVLGVLPLGTMNRFARSLGIPAKLDEAIAILRDGIDISIDVGEVNDEIFVNTCTIGPYAQVAAFRERERSRHAYWPRWLRWCVDTLKGAKQAWNTRSSLELRMELGRRTFWRSVPAMLVTNNPLPAPGCARTLDQGVIAIHLPRTRRKLGLLWLSLQAVWFGVEGTRNLEEFVTQRAVVKASRPAATTLDGEACELGSPLSFRSRPSACRVRVPNPKEAARV